MRKIFLTLAILATGLASAQQQNPPKKELIETKKLVKPYHPGENADVALKKLARKASAENKKILVQAGGNWCIWCLRLNDFITSNPALKKALDEKFLVYHLNYSKEDKNTALFTKYGNPGEKYGYPVWLVLDKNLKLLQTIETGTLENGKSYDEAKIRTVLGL